MSQDHNELYGVVGWGRKGWKEKRDVVGGEMFHCIMFLCNINCYYSANIQFTVSQCHSILYIAKDSSFVSSKPSLPEF